MNIMHSFHNGNDQEEFGVFASRTMWNKVGDENRRLLDVEVAKNKWRSDLQINSARGKKVTRAKDKR